jgi:hypothetical protein
MKVALVLSLLLSGCALSPTIADAAKARAATDLNCPSERISTHDSVGGAVVVRGCGAWTQYTCFYTGGRSVGRFATAAGDPICVTDAPARVLPDTSVEPNQVTLRDQHLESSGIRHGNMCIGHGCD